MNQDNDSSEIIRRLKRKTYRFYKQIKERFQLWRMLLQSSPHYSNDLFTKGIHKEMLDVVTISFNQPEMTFLQVKLIKKFLLDPHTHIIADNSNDLAKAEETAKKCKELKVLYVRLPKNPFHRNKSHGAAMHWVFRNVLKRRNSQIIGFLDHDIYPTRQCSIKNKMKNGIYGRPTHAYGPNGKWVNRTIKHPHWALWAGFFFLKHTLLNNTHSMLLDFNPLILDNGNYLDTAGGLWKSVYKKLEYPSYLLEFNCKFFESKIDKSHHKDFYEIYDDWIHIANLSNWRALPDHDEKINNIKVKILEVINQDLSMENTPTL